MKLIFPLKREKYVTQKFGERPEYYSQFKIGGVVLRGHEGEDYRAENGTEVVACDEGFCQEVLDQGKTGYGKYVKIVHSWGESVYAHLQEFKVKQGAQAKQGQTIALSNNSGNSSGAHLHFGIRVNPYNRADGWGGYSDPAPYFGEISTELDMPVWAKNLKPFFIETGLKDDQIEGEVRDWFADHKILQGFVPKWVEKFSLKTDEADLGHVEMEMEKLLDTETLYNELVSSCEVLVGHKETPEGLRNAMRVVQQEMKTVSDQNKILTDKVEELKKKRTLDRFDSGELLTEIFMRLINQIKDKIKGR